MGGVADVRASNRIGFLLLLPKGKPSGVVCPKRLWDIVNSDDIDQGKLLLAMVLSG